MPLHWSIDVYSPRHQKAGTREWSIYNIQSTTRRGGKAGIGTGNMMDRIYWESAGLSCNRKNETAPTGQEGALDSTRITAGLWMGQSGLRPEPGLPGIAPRLILTLESLR